MKKILLLSFILSAIISTSAYAQPKANQSAPPAVDKAAMLEKMKEQFRAPMIEKTGLTGAQVDRVIEINLEIRMEASTQLQGLNDEDRKAKLAEFKAEKEKRYAAIPLTQDQIKSVYAFYEDLGKAAPPKKD